MTATAGRYAGNRHVDHAETRERAEPGAGVAAGGRSATTRASFSPASASCSPSSSRCSPIANGTSRFSPDFLSEFVLYALSAADLTMLVALVFVLARNIIKLVVERRRALPFARFRAKLVALLLGMTLVPAVLVLIVGSELIRTSIDRWFNAPMEDILSSANQIAGDYYHERQMLVSDHASRLARALAGVDLASADVRPIRDLLAPDVTLQRVQMVEVYRVVPAAGSLTSLEPVVDVAAPTLPRGLQPRRGRIGWRRRRSPGRRRRKAIETLGAAGDLLHAAAVIRTKDGKPTGVVVATDYLTGDLAARSRRMTQAFENYNQLRVLKRPLTGLYLSFFLMVTLLILVGATWMGLVSREADHAAGADARRPPRARSAPAASISASSRRATTSSARSSRRSTRWRASSRPAAARSIAATIELERKHRKCEGRRRYIETILERITTGVVSIDAAGAITTINSAAARLLSLDRVDRRPAGAWPCFDRADLQPLAALLAGAGRGRAEPPAQEIAMAREGQELHLAVVATALVGDSGAPEGVVLVLDDVTPLIRAQKVAAWREVARRLAHEIKNPLTPIQLCAERLRRHFARRRRRSQGARRRVHARRSSAKSSR